MSFWTVSLVHCDFNDWRTYSHPSILLKSGILLSYTLFFIKETSVPSSCVALREELGSSLFMALTLFSLIVPFTLWAMISSLSKSDWKPHRWHKAFAFLCWAPGLCWIWNVGAQDFQPASKLSLIIFELEKPFQWAMVTSHNKLFST